MSASASDYFIEATPGFATTIGAGGVASAVVTTVPLTSVSGLSTTTAVEVVINYHDATGAVTNNYETVRGTVSGTSLINCARGVEGTAQAWDAGVVVEYLVTADIQNRMVTGIVVGHTQAGLHNTTIVSANGTMTLPSATDTFAALAATQTFTNKRITKRVGSTTSSATPTINTDNVDIYRLTAQAADITSFTTNLSGTPTEGQMLLIEITGTDARAITWGASFEASTVALPTTTVTTAMLQVLFKWNSATSKWRCISSV